LGQYCAFWNIMGACDEAKPSPSMVESSRLEI
jgi:hypothetical protein